MKRPAFQFYPGNWQSDIALRACSVGARGCWIEMMCLMHQAEPYGHLLLNGNAIGPDQLAGMIGGRATAKDVRGWLAELEANGVFSRNGDGTIFSRRMVRDEALRDARAEGGKAGSEHGSKGADHGRKGGRPRKPRGDSKPPSDETTGDSKPPLKPPPSSASASSTSSSVTAENTSNAMAARPPDGGGGRSKEISDGLRQLGVSIPTSDSTLRRWADEGITDEQLINAVEEAKGYRNGSRQPIGAAYLDRIVRNAGRAGPDAPFPAWRSDDQQCDQLGRVLGLRPNAGEEYPAYRQRIAAKLRHLRQDAA